MNGDSLEKPKILEASLVHVGPEVEARIDEWAKHSSRSWVLGSTDPVTAFCRYAAGEAKNGLTLDEIAQIIITKGEEDELEDEPRLCVNIITKAGKEFSNAVRI